jgi:hypothetical protein
MHDGKLTMQCSVGPNKEWNEGYVFHSNADKVFRDFFGGDNPFAGQHCTPTKNAVVMQSF